MTDPTPMTDLHLLPGDAHPGLLDGWVGHIKADGLFDGDLDGVLVGPDLRPEGTRAGPWEVYRPGGWAYSSETETMSVGAAEITLDLRRPECIDHVIRVLAEGVRCSVWPHMIDRTGLTTMAKSEPDCDCGETGWRIVPADVSRFRNLPAWQAAAILAASVLRVVAGEEPVKKIERWTPPAMPRVVDLYVGQKGICADLGSFILVPLTNGAIARVEGEASDSKKRRQLRAAARTGGVTDAT